MEWQNPRPVRVSLRSHSAAVSLRRQRTRRRRRKRCRWRRCRRRRRTQPATLPALWIAKAHFAENFGLCAPDCWKIWAIDWQNICETDGQGICYVEERRKHMLPGEENKNMYVKRNAIIITCQVKCQNICLDRPQHGRRTVGMYTNKMVK